MLVSGAAEFQLAKPVAEVFDFARYVGPVERLGRSTPSLDETLHVIAERASVVLHLSESRVMAYGL